MNINPKAKTILCFGDSNTFGRRPDGFGRYPADERWTGIVQKTLGNDYYVIEEGLGGRTTHFDNNDARPTRNGLLYFGSCLESHLPLDYVVIMLGTNDLKNTYSQSPQDIAESVGVFVQNIRDITDNRKLPQPRILLISPAHLDSKAPGYFIEGGELDAESAEKSQRLALAIETIARKQHCDFLDAASLCAVGRDGVHLDARSHTTLGKAVASTLLTASI